MQSDSVRRNFLYTQLTFFRKICNLKPLPTLQCIKKLVKEEREKGDGISISSFILFQSPQQVIWT